ncbi:LysR substrate-binding domain-containing protein (plasmid) [Ensifer adhaerens]|uniref:LysR substrate-binding domain-containing protein n=1 Tax=Ensifer adhaerens TaxID=106592 RepID=UPI0023A9C678|nr:LysR substrate-binding domain-containing protein [Ensifer adhaerens]WDZ80167.1 LysR substrate-binding domain-containing protein [Ensifer adhaerens]
MSAVRAFEAAARHLSFTRAADELGMTQAAVSYQIRLLEDRVGTPLFVRLPREVRLTTAGRQLAPKVTEAIDLLGAAFSEIADKTEHHLHISVLPTVVSSWLGQRLASFQTAHPNISIRVHMSTELVDFKRDAIDLAVRSGAGDWPGNDVFPLFPLDYVPVCTPSFLEKHQLKEPSDVLRVRRFGNASWWRRWMIETGVEPPASNGTELIFDVQAMDVATTLADHGIAIAVSTFLMEELKSGRLIRPFDHVVRDGRAYWLVYPQSSRRQKKIQAFRDWVVSEADASNAQLATVMEESRSPQFAVGASALIKPE